MAALSQEVRDFLMVGTRTAKLATVRKDGRPHVVPVWFIIDGGDIVFNTGRTTVKGANIRRDGRVCICVDDEQPPFSFATIEGTTEISEEPSELLRVATGIARRYMGADKAEEYGKRNGVPGELVVRVRSTHVIFNKDVAD